MKTIKITLIICLTFFVSLSFAQNGINVAKGKPITVEYDDLTSDGNYSLMNDGNQSTILTCTNNHEWGGPEETGHFWFSINLGKVYQNPQIKINYYSSNNDNFSLEVSTDGSIFIPKGDIAPNTLISITGDVKAVRFTYSNMPGDELNISEAEIFTPYLTGVWSKDDNKNIFYTEGAVGIGTTIFSQDASAKLIVNGKISAEEVEVKAIAADFVFDENYKLKSLDEVEKYIKANKHLPEVAPAIETVKGVNLGDFNQTLLQKVEELTLYIIDLNKQINSIKQENNQLKTLLNDNK